ncbi:MAG: hypothetical protein OEY00_00010 [Gammaproteobacteria bacterium]|nr:hypothetical protein [Gammaproteobacteria bacterium]
MSTDSDNNFTKATEKLKNKGQIIKHIDIDIAIGMLTKYMNEQDIISLVSALETLKSAPQNEDLWLGVIKAFDELGVLQGAALTYAPYLNIFVSDDPFGD